MNCLLKTMSNNPSLRNSERTVKRLFESTSFVLPRGKIVYNHFRQTDAEVIKETSTQTSTTFVSVGLSTARMSPDSLSPRTTYQDDLNLDLDIGKGDDVNDAQYSRKGCVLRYLHKPKLHEESDNSIGENSLTRTFLDKKMGQLFSSPRITRSNFLQQTSPLNKIIEDPRLKSKSHFEILSSPRFEVMNVREKNVSPTKTKPVRFYCEKELSLDLNSTSRSAPKHSFMSPTFSSEQKNKMKEIKTVTRLISPTRRGRSASPKPNISKGPLRRVPYIDKSSSSIFQANGDSILDLSLRSPKRASKSTLLQTFQEIPENDLAQAITRMKELDWNTALRGLADVVEICRTTDKNITFPHMIIVNQRLIELLKSPRSHVCRTTCKAVGHLFEYIKDTRRPEFDEIVDTLLCRTADSNKFIRHDANLALDCMVTHMPLLHAVRALCAKGPDHKNALVRIATARLVVCAVVISGVSLIFNPNNSDYTRKRLILNMVKFLNDKSLEARKYGERLFRLLNADKMFDFYQRRYLEQDIIQKLKICFKINHRNGTN